MIPFLMMSLDLRVVDEIHKLGSGKTDFKLARQQLLEED
jgi:hypothetical protein